MWITPQARGAVTKAANRHRDPVEKILSAHGVPNRLKTAVEQGPREPETIAAIISDIRAFRANGGRLN